MNDADEGGGPERRKTPRRSLPFGRGAVLQIGDRHHVVGLADVSEGGALVLTRAVASVGDPALLKLSIVSRRVQMALRCAVVRVVASESAQRGLAVRFIDPDDEARASIAAFVAGAPGGHQP